MHHQYWSAISDTRLAPCNKLFFLFYGRGKAKGLGSLASTTCSSHPDFGVAVSAHSLVHSSWDVVIMRHYTVLFFSFKHGRLLPDEVCNVRSQLLAAQSGGEGPEFSSNASMLPSLDYARLTQLQNGVLRDLISPQLAYGHI